MDFRQDTQNIFFPNQVEPVYDPLDPVSDYNFKEYWKRERDRCINGFYLADGQVFISGHLYFHCVYWKIAAYIEDEATGRKPRKIITPWLRDIDWDIINNDFVECEKQGRFYNLVGSRDFGKALHNSSILYTPIGELQIGNAEVGDRIYGADGKLTTITGVYPQGKVDLYKITYADGRVSYCCDEHLWKVWNSVKRKYEVLPLKEIRKDYLISKKVSYKNRKGVEYKYAIPNNAPVEYEDNILLPIDPYFLGLWLGDGDSRYVRITTVDKPIEEYVSEYAGSLGLEVIKSGKNGYRVTSGKQGGQQYDRNRLLNYFKDLDLLQNKHIPDAYFYTSIDNRLSLLQGLMDTDGTVCKNGSVEFNTSNPTLAKDFYRLVRSLGIIATIKKRNSSYKKNGITVPCKTSYRFRLLTKLPVFKLKRKLSRMATSYRSEKTSIVNIEYYGKDYATCITVDNEDKLFLTDNYTVTHNSIIAASRAGWLYTFFNNSESVISGGESTYIKLATDKIEDGLQNIHPVFKKQRLMSDWKKEVKAGWKEKKTNLADPRSSNSRILIRNYEMGTKTMAANGTRPGFHLIDEIGTMPNLIGCIKDSDGCWWSGGGDKPSCLVMITGTGGDMEVGAEAAEVFFNPEAYNMLSFKNEWEGGYGSIGRFIPATRAKLKFKEPKTLAEYLGISHPDLEKITILVSNEERALTEWWEPEHAKAVKSNNPKTILKFKAYWPLKPSDSFLRISHNDFDITNAKKQQIKLRDKQITGIPVDLIYEDGKVTHKFNNRQAINQFPFKLDDEDVKKGTVIIYEPPVPFPPYGLYVGGVDPYKQDTAKYSDSLGAIYIFKRMHDIATEEYQDMIVAQYVGRPRSIDEWCETSRNLIKYYNAQTLVENEDIYFIKYMINKGDGHYLVDQPKWLIDNAGIANSSVKRDKGIHATPKIITYLNGVLKQYTEELRQTLRDENDSVIGDVRGMDHIFDPMLLEEMIQFSKGGNYDRIRAASLAIAQARHFDKNLKIKTLGGDSRLESVKKAASETASRTMFSKPRRKTFNNTKRLFR